MTQAAGRHRRGDIPVLATLIGAGADILVSGDRGLPALSASYPLVTPAEFARRS